MKEIFGERLQCPNCSENSHMISGANKIEGSTYIFLAVVNLNLFTFLECSIVKAKTMIIK